MLEKDCQPTWIDYEIEESEKVKQILSEYCEVSSIGGLYYITHNIFSKWMRLFWVFVLLIMLALAVSMSVQSYQTWKSEPVRSSLRG